MSEQTKTGFFQRLKQGLSKTTKEFTDKIDTLISGYGKIDEAFYDELEEILITADLGFDITMELIESLREKVKEVKTDDPHQVKVLLKELIINILSTGNRELQVEPPPAVVLVVGVNGVGKTTTIGKLAHYFKQQHKEVMLAAGDTFRAGAIDQLEVWGQRNQVPVIRHQEGSDPAAVIFDAIHSAKARNCEILICDTAGRLHNKKNLMNELGKIFRVVDREYPEARKEVLLVLDATTGQNALQQAKVFGEVAQLTGIVLTKLDGTAKGGIVLAITKSMGTPVKMIGVGEQLEDLQPFDPSSFAEALLGDTNETRIADDIKI
ncbi:signal recognition particle-docking protein FtsY [Anoxynatronum buryatiense]|uniref:Signal recognition particle receptor FtsY n=1 Tax=Anoxynatronum buryatiense TaxID=489973 RepID=A0AA45WUK5_9CLOT|nr:signal recognition particle-docking protein FtsY [Anoxynatronum buryatiense]SMP47043.1 signal recognition particle-docking protein FtsY [Anoxynatronum buryatiense]